eukprot:scaffold14635_cov201-Amphora_coffeaeformis.AAC.6
MSSGDLSNKACTVEDRARDYRKESTPGVHAVIIYEISLPRSKVIGVGIKKFAKVLWSLKGRMDDGVVLLLYREFYRETMDDGRGFMEDVVKS